MFTSIQVTPYRSKMGRSDGEQLEWKEYIQTNINVLLSLATEPVIDVYNMDGIQGNYQAGNTTRLCVFGNCYHVHASELQDESPYYKYRSDKLHLKDENGFVMAEFDEQYNELYILFDIFGDTENISIFRALMMQLNQEHYYKKSLDKSWLHTTRREKLVEYLTKTLTDQRNQFIAEEKDRIMRLKENVNNYRAQIKTALDQIDRKSRQVTLEEESVGYASQKLLKDFDLIVRHDKVKDLHLEDGTFIVYTNPLYMYTSKEERFYLGNMTIRMNPENTIVKFYGDNPRRSYWTDRDPHPHVDGSSGSACLGNASPLIAELCNQMELYALTLTCIDFLEQANIEDPAGRNVYQWDEVDAEGNIIRVGGSEDDEEDENSWTCNRCEESVTDEQHEVFDSYELTEDGPEVSGGHTVCNYCFENSYHYVESVDAHIRD